MASATLCETNSMTLPQFFAFAIVTAVGNIYAGLWYPVAFTLISVLTTLVLLPETKGRPLD